MNKTNIGGLPAGSYMVTHCDDKDKRIAELEKELLNSKESVKRNAYRIIERDNKIAELKAHYKQVIFNTAKVSFEEGACSIFNGTDFHEEAINFARKIHKEQGE